jgi:hypothetical protein
MESSMDDLPPSPRQETAVKAQQQRMVSRLSSMGGRGPADDGEVIQKHEDVQYDAAQLAALASSRPYSTQSSRRPSVQFADADMAAKLDALAASSGGSHDKATLRARHTFLTAAAAGSSSEGASAAGEGPAGSGDDNRGPHGGFDGRSSTMTTGGGAAREGAPLLHKPTWSMQHGKVQILSGEGGGCVLGGGTCVCPDMAARSSREASSRVLLPQHHVLLTGPTVCTHRQGNHVLLTGLTVSWLATVAHVNPFTSCCLTRPASMMAWLAAAVDDDNINRSVVESLLDSTGYEVVSARNGRQALAHLASCKAMPDLVLLDVMMPDLSG